jgi:endonuclease/exonuclease/phosphatase family metal-dependent hydrolase
VGMIRVVSWNVLADAYVRREYYPQTNPAVLERASRRAAVVDRLVSFADADVLCLQEVDDALFAAAQKRLAEWTGRLLRKTGRGEGCAIFVRSALAAGLEWKELVFADRSGHVALGVTFAGIAVVSTHLKWEPPGTPEETHRGRSQLAEICEAWPSGSRIVCGDFNDSPGGVVLRLAEERGLLDAYASMADANTCNANRKRRRIDFILHSADFKATPSLVSQALEDDTPLPSANEPSDHLAIEARLE